MTSATACAMRVASRSSPVGRTWRSSLSSRLATTVDQVGVAGALAVAVDAALHVGGAGGDGGQRVGDGAAAVVVAWMPTRAPVVSMTSSTTSETQSGSMPPLVSHSATTSAPGLGGGAQHLEGVRPVGAVAVEEVLGVEEDRLALLAQVGRRCRGPSRGSPRAWSAARARRGGRATWPRASRRRPRSRAARRRAGRRQRVRRRGGWRRTPRAARGAGRAPPGHGGRTRCPWGWPRASRPR